MLPPPGQVCWDSCLATAAAVAYLKNREFKMGYRRGCRRGNWHGLRGVGHHFRLHLGQAGVEHLVDLGSEVDDHSHHGTHLRRLHAAAQRGG